MKKRALADVLWEAANEHLSPGLELYEAGFDYSCEAVAGALGIEWDDWSQFLKRHLATAFMRSLGCKCGSARLFEKYESREERQTIRYMWLLLAAKVAEDENLFVEVA